MDGIRLVYFDIRGLAEPVRWMLRVAGMEFTDDRIPLDAWALGKRKNSLDTMLKSRKGSGACAAAEAGVQMRFVGQLPILFFGSLVLTQPLTILRFLARKAGLTGETEMQEARCEEISDLVYDLRIRALEYEGKAFKSRTPDIVRHTVFRDFRNAPDSPAKRKMREDFLTIWFPLYFSKFDDLLGSSGGEWIAGDSMTYGDLVLANFLDIAEEMMDPNCLAEFPKLRELKEKIFAVPEIVEWRQEQARKANAATANDSN